MPKNIENLNTHLYNNLYARGYDPIPLDSVGDESDEIEKADVFRFTLPLEDKKIPAWLTIEGDELKFYIGNNITKLTYFKDFTNFMKKWAAQRELRWVVDNRDRLIPDMKKRTNMKKKEQLAEAYHSLGKKASYNDAIPTVKIIIQHTRQLEENEQRFRNVDKIFVENTNGERFLLPTKRPGLARVYARHIAEGGTPYDDKGKHINTLVEEYTKMAGFVRATRSGQFNESALKLVNEGLKHYNNLKLTLTGLAGHRGYNKYFESYTPILNEETTDVTALNELFVQEKLDPRIESVLPILNRLNKNIVEMTELTELDNWAENLINEKLNVPNDSTDKTLAVSGSSMLDEKGLSDLFKKKTRSDIPSNTDLSGSLSDIDKTFKPGSGVEQHTISPRTLRLTNKIKSLLTTDLSKVEYVKVTLPISKKYEPLIKKYLGKYNMKFKTSGNNFRINNFENEWNEILVQDPKVYKPLLQSYMGLLQELPDDDGFSLDVGGQSIKEAPGAETLKHNQDIEKSNLKAFDLEEGFSPSIEVADMIMKSMGGAGKLTSDDIYRAVDEYQTMMDNPEELDTEEVAQIIIDRLHSKGIMVPDISEDLDAFDLEEEVKPKVYFVVKKDGNKVVGTWNGEIFKPFDRSKYPAGSMDMIPSDCEVDRVSGPIDKSQHDKVKAVTEKAVEEDLDANQKRAGQLGPTEKVGKKGIVGKLVGANESTNLESLLKLSGIK